MHGSWVQSPGQGTKIPHAQCSQKKKKVNLGFLCFLSELIIHSYVLYSKDLSCDKFQTSVFLFPGKTVCTLDGSLQIGLQRQDHGRQFLQLRSSEYSFLSEDAAFKSRSSVNTRADHNWYKSWMSGVPSLSKKVQEQAGKRFSTYTLVSPLKHNFLVLIGSLNFVSGG